MDKAEVITVIKTTSTCKSDPSTGCLKEITRFWTLNGELIFTNENTKNFGQDLFANVY